MKIGDFIYTALAADSNMTNLIPTTKMFPSAAVKATSVPYLVYYQLSQEPTDTKGSYTTSTSAADMLISQKSPLDKVSVQISVFAAFYVDCVNAANQVRITLDRITPGTYGTNDINVQSCVFEGMTDGYEEKANDRGLFAKHMDFVVRQVVAQS